MSFVTQLQKLFDEKGLCLLLTPSGGRLRRFKYRFPPRVPGNKEKCISLGGVRKIRGGPNGASIRTRSYDTREGEGICSGGG
jgi:hypothetical protein